MGFLKNVFKVLDPILDKLDPGHNKIQTWTTGHSDTEGQAPYFEKIAPMIVDAFYPGAGSALGAVDSASKGNYAGAVVGAVGAYAGLSGTGSGTWIGTAGKAIVIGANAYQIIDKYGDTKGFYGTNQPANMVSQAQQQGTIYSSSQAGTAYGKMTGASDAAAINAVGALAIAEAEAKAKENKIVFLVFVGMTIAIILRKIAWPIPST